MRERSKPSKARVWGSNTEEDGKDRKFEIVSGCLGRKYLTSQGNKRRKTSAVRVGCSNTDEDGQACVSLSHFSPKPKLFGGTSASCCSTEDVVGLHEEDPFYELCYDFEDAEYSNSLATVGIGEEKEVKESTLDFTFDPNANACEILPQSHLLEPCSDSFSLDDIVPAKEGILDSISSNDIVPAKEGILDSISSNDIVPTKEGKSGFDSHDSPSGLELSSSVVAIYSGLSDPKDATSVPKDMCCTSDVEDYGVWDIIHQMIDGGTTDEFLALMNEFQCNNDESTSFFAICASREFEPAQWCLMEDDSYSDDVLLDMTEFSSNETEVMSCSAVPSSNNDPSSEGCDASKDSVRGISGEESSLRVAVIVDTENSTSTSGELCLARSTSCPEEVKNRRDPATCETSKLQGSGEHPEIRKGKRIDENHILKQRTSPRKKSVATPHHPETVDITSKFCPDAITDYCKMEERKKEKDGSRGDIKPTTLRLNAKRHLLAVGWKLWYCPKRGKRELRYTSPQGKCFYSLRTACHAWLEAWSKGL